jgi:hypothetical protein
VASRVQALDFFKKSSRDNLLSYLSQIRTRKSRLWDAIGPMLIDTFGANLYLQEVCGQELRLA